MPSIALIGMPGAGKSTVGSAWDSFFLGGNTASDDFMAERAGQQQPERESF